MLEDNMVKDALKLALGGGKRVALIYKNYNRCYAGLREAERLLIKSGGCLFKVNVTELKIQFPKLGSKIWFITGDEDYIKIRLAGLNVHTTIKE